MLISASDKIQNILQLDEEDDAAAAEAAAAAAAAAQAEADAEAARISAAKEKGITVAQSFMDSLS
jgi:hypothetical protein